MGAGYFIIAILGCADGSSACTPVATLPTRYASAQECSAATAEAVQARTDFDFPTLLAQCRSTRVPAAAPIEPTRPVPADALRS